MNIKRLIPCFLLIGSLLLGSCENEQITDMEKQGTELPDGKYPLTFTAVQTAPIATPQTRVSENTDGMSSKWDGGEVIKVQIADGKAGTYTLDDIGKTTAQTPCYWQNTQSATINAWYSNITGQNTDDETVDLNNQQNGLAYVLKAVTTADYKTSNLELKFQHQLAKVRIKLTGDKANDVTNVHVNNYTSCTVTNGSVTGGSTGYIPMRKNGEYYEANVIPMETITADDFIRLNDDTKASINGITELKAENVYTITIDVKEEQLKEVNVSDITNTEYTISGNVHLKGDGQSKDLKLTVEAGAKLTIENVKLAPTNNANAITCQGNATITLKGNNTLTCSHERYCGIQAEGGTLTINGDDNATLVIEGENPSIGADNGANITINGGYITVGASGKKGQSAGIGGGKYGQHCGTVTINGGIIEAWGGAYSAGIGGSNDGVCGDIIITGGNIKAYGGLQSPGIGNGDAASCGDITISGANTVVYAKRGKVDLQKPAESIGWNNYNGSCGTVTIGSECTVTQE